MSRSAPANAAGGFTAGYRSIYILPTRYGVWFAALSLVTLIAGVNYANGLAYGLTFLLTGLALVAMLHTHRNVNGLVVRATPCTPVFAGETAAFPAVLENAGSYPRWGIEFWHAGSANAVDVPAQSAVVVTAHVPTRRRGRVAPPPVYLATRFPLSLWRAWTRRALMPESCVVYPTPASVSALPSAWALHGDGGAAVGTGAGDDFKGLREYRPGDAPKHIAWKALAAGRGQLTKYFGSGTPTLLWLDWETLAGKDAEERLSILCRGVLEAERAHRSYGLRLPGVDIAPGHGAAQAARCLEALALYRA